MKSNFYNEDTARAGNQEFVVALKDRCTMELVGGKAFNLSKMAKKGFKIPEGFCITTRAYDYFTNYNNISEDAEIADRIREGVIPPLLQDVVCSAYRTYLDGALCAVRSSSPLEDLKSTSFAGQYESFLNVTGESALLNAVKECWASLWSLSALEYRKRMEIKNENIKMAVLVQEMIPAAASGVLFTEDPMVVECVWGLGDTLVGGKVTPDRVVVEKHTLKVKERTISHKQIMSKMNPCGGIDEVEVPDPLKDTAVLDDDHILKLCTLGKKVEDLFGCPQDIEWAFLNGTFALLQARPITVEKPIVWSRANVAESHPGYVTYLSRNPEDRPDDILLALLPLLERFGITDVPDIKLREYIYGHAYLNMNVAADIIGKIPGLSPDVVYQALGHSAEEVSESTLELSSMVKLLPGTVRVILFFLNLPKRAKQVIPSSLDLIEDIRHTNVQELTLKELDNLVWHMYHKNSHVFQVHACTALGAMGLFGLLQKMTARVGAAGIENTLMGLEGMSSSQLGVEMWKLAHHASRSTKISELILSGEKDILKELRHSEEGTEFLKEFNQFLEKYGDRCSWEPELSMPRWEENPDFVLSMVANYLRSHADPVKTMEEHMRARQKVKDQLSKKVHNPLEKVLIKKVLEKTEQYIVIRENLKTVLVKGISVLKILYVTIAEKLVDKGILENQEDIFYLKVTEVSDVIADNLEKRQVKRLIKERKKEKKECEHLDVPDVIIGNPPPIKDIQYTVTPREKLEGTGCSPGVVTGKALVGCNPGECTGLKEGDILVAPVTDPGWSPLFVTAGGLVMELGGTLSHGVIIAREYGIPAVVGVKNATKIIKTGQVITVDGNKGLVYIR
ncbi:MAG: hypothetical protein HXS48_07155 [Theionarchaea archaeon]|nr:hypothetical protein [Theionarchaea archaeon]